MKEGEKENRNIASLGEKWFYLKRQSYGVHSSFAGPREGNIEVCRKEKITQHAGGK